MNEKNVIIILSVPESLRKTQFLFDFDNLLEQNYGVSINDEFLEDFLSFTNTDESRLSFSLVYNKNK